MKLPEFTCPPVGTGEVSVCCEDDADEKTTSFSSEIAGTGVALRDGLFFGKGLSFIELLADDTFFTSIGFATTFRATIELPLILIALVICGICGIGGVVPLPCVILGVLLPERTLTALA